MSGNESDRRSRRSGDHYQNSSVCNRSMKSSANNFSIQLPHRRKKYSPLEQQLINRNNKTKNNKPTINLTNCKYHILQQVCGNQVLGWKVQNIGDSKNWTIRWCDTGMTGDQLQRMSYYQKVNHFPATSLISRKNTLAMTLAPFKQKFPQQYDYLPRTFLYPQDYPILKTYHTQSLKRGLLKTFIVKPQAGCQGRGIYLTQDLSQIQNESKCVIQKYISNPLLTDGLKFDLRIYVLLACISPLRIYIYNQGLVRLATQPYQLPNVKNLDNMFMHLTNYAINKQNPKYIYNRSVEDMRQGHKQSLAQFFKILKDRGHKANLYWNNIKDQIIKTILAVQPQVFSNYRINRPHDSTYDMCFQILGFDFMIDNNHRTHLLQVNHTPSLATDTPLDHIIKKNLIKDTLQMMNILPQQLKGKQQLQRLRQRQKYVKFKHGNDNSLQQKQILIQKINKLRAEHEEENMGTYQLIYPSKNINKQNKYNQILNFSSKQFQLSTNHSSVISTTDIRARLKEIPNTKHFSNNIKQSITRQVTEQPQKKDKRNIIYNYNYIKHSPSKRYLQQQFRVEVHPRQRLYTDNDIRKVKSKVQHEYELSKRIQRQKIKSQQKGSSSQINLIKRQRQRIPEILVKQQKKYINKQLNNFTNKIRSYRTPFMF